MTVNELLKHFDYGNTMRTNDGDKELVIHVIENNDWENPIYTELNGESETNNFNTVKDYKVKNWYFYFQSEILIDSQFIPTFFLEIYI